MPSPVVQALSMFQSILYILSHGQSINHNIALYISNYYINSAYNACILDTAISKFNQISRVVLGLVDFIFEPSPISSKKSKGTQHTDNVITE